MVTVEIKQSNRQIEEVYVLLETEDVVLARIITEAKYPQVAAIIGGCGLILQNGEHFKCQIRFRGIPFEMPHLVYSCDRYSLDVCFYNSNLLLRSQRRLFP